MEEARQLSNEELYETVKGFWGSNLPPFEDFEKCGKGLRADDKKKAWFIRQSGNFIRIEVFSHAALGLTDCGTLICKNGEWVRWALIGQNKRKGTVKLHLIADAGNTVAELKKEVFEKHFKPF